MSEACEYVLDELAKSSMQSSELLTELIIAALSAIMSVLTGLCLHSIFTHPGRFERLRLRNKTRRQLRDFRSLPVNATADQLNDIAATLQSQVVEDAMVSGLLRLGRTVQQEELQTVWGQNATG